MLGEATDVVMTGADRTSVFPMVQEITKAMNLKIVPEEHHEAGYYYRSFISAWRELVSLHFPGSWQFNCWKSQRIMVRRRTRNITRSIIISL